VSVLSTDSDWVIRIELEGERGWKQINEVHNTLRLCYYGKAFRTNRRWVGLFGASVLGMLIITMRLRTQ